MEPTVTRKPSSFDLRFILYNLLIVLCLPLLLIYLGVRLLRGKQRRSLPELDSEEQLLRVPDRARDARPDTHALGNELRERIFAAIEKLPRKHREVILLREVEGLSYQEIAATVACSEGTVMSRLFYARERLRRELEPYLKDAG